jgi:drug/metabolite transporter (DMT)-like permease
MVFVVGIAAAVSLGLGWVLQQRVAAHAALSELLSFRLLLHLMRKRVWWFGIAAMVCGQALGGLALSLGSVALVEPLLSTNLVFAFVIAAYLSHESTRPLEIGGALLVCAALGVFIGVGQPQPTDNPAPGLAVIILAALVVFGVAALLVAAARGKPLATKSVLFATGAGLMYGLQDVATRATLLDIDRHGLASLIISPWVYTVVGCALIGILLSQSAFRAGRLDLSLPPTAAAEPIAGIALGVTVLGDSLASSTGALTAEALCVVAMVLGAWLVGQSATLGTMPHVGGHHPHLPHPHKRSPER